MNNLTHYFAAAKLWLEAINPAAPWLALTLASWLTCLALRKWAPTYRTAFLAWGPPNGAIEKIVGSLPIVAASAVVATIGTGGDPWGAALGAVAGLGAPLLHHIAKWLKFIPYRGSLGKETTGPESRRAIVKALTDDDPNDVEVSYEDAQVKVVINGVTKLVTSPATYEQIVAAAHMGGTPSTTLKSGAGGRTVAPGDTVHLFDGDKINVAHTSSA